MLLLTFVALPFAPAFAIDLSQVDGWRSLLPRHGGWTVLAGLGLAAVAVAALTVRRPRKHTAGSAEPLGRMRDDPQPLSPASTRPVAGPAVAVPALPASGEGAMLPAQTGRTPRNDARESLPPLAADGSQLFLALHHVDLSIGVLRRHLQREARPMPAVWLMLLDLCRTHGREETFREIAIEFHERFNVRTPAWDGFPADRDDPGLEAYPRLVKEITLTWGTHECRRLLDRLLYDNRDNRRKGFTLNAYNDLIALRRAADAVLDTIEQDLAEEAKVRTAFALASADFGSVPSDESANAAPSRSPLVSDLETVLDDDVRAGATPQSAIEREHPALAKMLTREWGNAAMSARLCDMLARGGDGAHALSGEASEELEILREMAQRLCAANGIELPGADTK